MVVKDVRGRRRYIAFQLNVSFKRADVVSRLRSYARGKDLYVVQCSDGWAIVECGPKEVGETILLMKRVDPSSISMLTSGTIISLRKRYINLRKSRRSVKR